MEIRHGFETQIHAIPDTAPPPEPPEPEPRGGILPVAARKSRVLVADDEALICWSVAEALLAAGYEAVTAESVAKALELVEDPAQRIDMAIIDLRLGDGSGLTVLQRLRDRGVPAVLMTAYAAPELLPEAEAAGALCVVAKPFDLGDIIRLVGHTLRDE